MIAIEPWTAVLHYASARGELNKAIIERFRAAHIEFPAPAMTTTCRKDNGEILRFYEFLWPTDRPEACFESQ